MAIVATASGLTPGAPHALAVQMLASGNPGSGLWYDWTTAGAGGYGAFASAAPVASPAVNADGLGAVAIVLGGTVAAPAALPTASFPDGPYRAVLIDGSTGQSRAEGVANLVEGTEVYLASGGGSGSGVDQAVVVSGCATALAAVNVDAAHMAILDALDALVQGGAFTAAALAPVGPAVLDALNGIETGITPRMALRALQAFCAGSMQPRPGAANVLQFLRPDGRVALEVTSASGQRTTVAIGDLS